MLKGVEELRNRINLRDIPFIDRGSRLILLRHGTQFYIRFAERPTVWITETGDYHQNATVIDHITLSTEVGTAIPFQIETFPHVVHLRGDDGQQFDWAFADADTLLLRLPAGRHRIAFEICADHVVPDVHGVSFTGKHHGAVTTNAAIHERNILQIQDGTKFRCDLLIVSNGDAVITFAVAHDPIPSCSLPDAHRVIEEARTAWEQWFDTVPDLPADQEKYRRQYLYAWWIMRAGLLPAAPFFSHEYMNPSKLTYVGVWQWDQFFHAIAYRHIDLKLAEDQLRLLLAQQREDGLLPDAIYNTGPVWHLVEPLDVDITKPPLFAWAALKVYEKSGNLAFLRDIYAPLRRWHEWWSQHSSDANGLAHYHHPNSSGLDDSPLWDVIWKNHRPVVAVDLNTYLCIHAESLAKIAGLLGEDADSAMFLRDADQRITLMMQHFWDEQSGVFNYMQGDTVINVQTPFALLPLWTGRLVPTVAKRLIAHLTNPATFWTTYPIPSVSAADPCFDPEQMWRGPTWINIAYMFIEALRRHGAHEYAAELRQKTLDLVNAHENIYEYYHPHTGDAPPRAAPMFGWSAALFIDLLIGG